MNAARFSLRRQAVSVVFGVGLAAAGFLGAVRPAAAATPEYARLTITRNFDHPGYYNVSVVGHYNTTQATSTVGMRLKGADVFFDDDLGVSVTGRASYGEFALYALVWHGTLNEDPEGGDEIYASVRSSTGWSKHTNEVSGNF
jgi:hypothetical protein